MVKTLLVTGMAVATTVAAAAQTLPGTGGTPGANAPIASQGEASEIHLTPEQKTLIADSIRQQGKPVTPPIAFEPKAGAMAPPSIELYPIPDSALDRAPEAKNLKYTMVKDQVVLIDPLTMRVVDAMPK